MRPTFLLAATLIPASAAIAQDFIFTLSPPSSLTLAPEFSILTEGTLIGDYDAATNPAGTLTRPGFFGGSGNNPIPTSIDLALAGSDSTRPDGTFRFAADEPSFTFTLSSLGVDLLGGQTLDIPLTLGLLYETFRTFAPNSLYIGGVRLPIPLGNASISSLSFTQSAPVPGVLIPADAPRIYTFATLVPVNATIAASILGQTFDLPNLPAALPITGTLNLTGPTPSITIAWDLGNTTPLPPELIAQIPPIENQALPLPTILPPGATANLLLNLTVTAGEVGLATAATLYAEGAVRCLADFNNDGVLDWHDYDSFLAAFESGDPAADVNADAFLDGFDYLDFVTAFETACSS
jgi:hypothetical protein